MLGLVTVGKSSRSKKFEIEKYKGNKNRGFKFGVHYINFFFFLGEGVHYIFVLYFSRNANINS